MIKIAGDTGPSQRFRSDVQALFKLPEDQLVRLATWLARPENPLPSSQDDVVSLASEQTLDIDLVDQALPLIRFILANWHGANMSFNELMTDLEELGVCGEELKVASRVFAPLETAKDKFFLSSLRGQAEIAGIPTLDDSSFFWDIRPVFEDSDFSRSAAPSGASRWLTNVYLLIAELSCSRRDGKRESLTLQLTESDVSKLLESLEKAKTQLEILKRKQFV